MPETASEHVPKSFENVVSNWLYKKTCSDSLRDRFSFPNDLPEGVPNVSLTRPKDIPEHIFSLLACKDASGNDFGRLEKPLEAILARF